MKPSLSYDPRTDKIAVVIGPGGGIGTFAAEDKTVLTDLLCEGETGRTKMARVDSLRRPRKHAEGGARAVRPT